MTIKRFVPLVLFLLATQYASAQVAVPRCGSADAIWTNCVGRQDGYEGEWKNNMYWGTGTLYLGPPSFAVYKGEFVGGKQHGRGVLYSYRGEVVLSGQWIRGNFNSQSTSEAAAVNGARQPSARPLTTLESITDLSGAIDTRPRTVPTPPTSARREERGSALDKAKRECKDLGFKEKTEKYGSCVLELSRRSEGSLPMGGTASDDLDNPDAIACQRYGYQRGSSGYSDCRMQLDLARQDYEAKLRLYEEALAEYQRVVAADSSRPRRQSAADSSNYNFCIAACNVRRGSNPLACMSECGGGASSPVRSQATLPQPPPGRSTYMINGQTIYCSARPQGAALSVTCN